VCTTCVSVAEVAGVAFVGLRAYYVSRFKLWLDTGRAADEPAPTSDVGSALTVPSASPTAVPAGRDVEPRELVLTR
jgi:hypothetical protein